MCMCFYQSSLWGADCKTQKTHKKVIFVWRRPRFFTSGCLQRIEKSIQSDNPYTITGDMMENPLMHRDKLYEGIYSNVNQLLPASLLQKSPRVGKKGTFIDSKCDEGTETPVTSSTRWKAVPRSGMSNDVRSGRHGDGECLRGGLVVKQGRKPDRLHLPED